MSVEAFAGFEQVILEKKGASHGATDNQEKKRGKLLVDATVALQTIRYPADLILLNEAWEISENLIDELYALSDCTKKQGGTAVRRENNIWPLPRTGNRVNKYVILESEAISIP